MDSSFFNLYTNQTSMQDLMKEIGEAIRLDGESRDKEAYVKYSTCVYQIASNLLHNARVSGWGLMVTPSVSRQVKLLQQCVDRVNALVSKMEKDQSQMSDPSLTPRIPGIQMISSGMVSKNSNSLNDDTIARAEAEHFARTQSPIHQIVRTVSDLSQDCDFGRKSLPTHINVPALMDSNPHNYNKVRTLSPLEKAHAQNKSLIIAYKARMKRLNKSNFSAYNYSLTLQRKMAENLALAKAQEEELAKKMKARQVRLEEEAARRFAHPADLTLDEKEHQQIYKNILDYENDVEWLSKWRQRLSTNKEDPVLICQLVQEILRCSDHPFTQMLRKLQFKVHEQLYPLVANKHASVDLIKVDLPQALWPTLDEVSDILPTMFVRTSSILAPEVRTRKKIRTKRKSSSSEDVNVNTVSKSSSSDDVVNAVSKSSSSDEDGGKDGGGGVVGGDDVVCGKNNGGVGDEDVDSGGGDGGSNPDTGIGGERLADGVMATNEGDGDDDVGGGSGGSGGSSNSKFSCVDGNDSSRSSNNSNSSSSRGGGGSDGGGKSDSGADGGSDNINDRVGDKGTESVIVVGGEGGEEVCLDGGNNKEKDGNDSSSSSPNLCRVKKDSIPITTEESGQVGTTHTDQPGNNDDACGKSTATDCTGDDDDASDIEVSARCHGDSGEEEEEEKSDSDSPRRQITSAVSYTHIQLREACHKGRQLEAELTLQRQQARLLMQQISRDYDSFDADNFDDLFDDDDDDNNNDEGKEKEMENSIHGGDDGKKAKFASARSDSETGNEISLENIKSVQKDRGVSSGSSSSSMLWRSQSTQSGQRSSLLDETVETSFSSLPPTPCTDTTTTTTDDGSGYHTISKLTIDAYERHLRGICNEIHLDLDKLLQVMMVAYETLNTPVGKDQCAVALEEPFFKPVWKTLLRLFRVVNHRKERVMACVMTSYRDAKPETLKVRERFCLAGSGDGEGDDGGRGKPYQEAIDQLLRLPQYYTIYSKLDCMVQVCRLICECIDNFYSSQSQDSPKGKVKATPVMGADDLLPVLTYVIISTGCPQLVSECQAMTEFIAEGYMMGEEGYCLTTFRTAMEYLLSLFVPLMEE